jgi:uncharacterized protein YggU (UPF0235/DUF167 family)
MLIDAFRAAVGINGMQKASHFQVEIHAPPNVGMYNNTVWSYYVREVNLPGRNMTTSEIKYGTNPTQKQVYNSIPTDLTVTFMADQKLGNWKFFQDWQNAIHDPNTGFVGYPADYKGTVVVHTLNQQGQIQYTQTMIDAFPENINDISFNYGAEEMATFQVTFSYTRLETKSVGFVDSILNKISGAV